MNVYQEMLALDGRLVTRSPVGINEWDTVAITSHGKRLKECVVCGGRARHCYAYQTENEDRIRYWFYCEEHSPV